MRILVHIRQPTGCLNLDHQGSLVPFMSGFDIWILFCHFGLSWTESLDKLYFFRSILTIIHNLLCVPFFLDRPSNIEFFFPKGALDQVIKLGSHTQNLGDNSFHDWRQVQATWLWAPPAMMWLRLLMAGLGWYFPTFSLSILAPWKVWYS